ncbi:AtpZ/AtpI family protein [Denitrificimonas caeni]|uniref:AtpZ/AtpI family protein n=1 Tax=Denitrificimonas caeni TaxID=521720 RepID=A0AAF0AKW7_9GAMM|nr:AtpZ/AtpI family protein [Denitrificimonas caeni]NLJ12088.1 ATPase F0F1 [Gammaproteobacteria bacterium]WBE24883.1 AtpZ/AtpI family protein [Denitrificimonas caeni]
MSRDDNKEDASAAAIRRRAERMQQSRNERKYSPLSGLGVFGVIGWSVAIPTVAGAFLGMWLNRVAPQSFSWPIALILGGVVVGAMVAWNWIEKNQDQ